VRCDVGWFAHLNYLESYSLAAVVVFAVVVLPAYLAGRGREEAL
jgi:hypothetical protein